jgi:hypothetical protein
MTTDTSSAELPEQASPFMELPAELRVHIYALAFKDIVDFITPTTPKLKGPSPELRGALALLHTNKKLRAESRRELLILVNAHREKVRATASLRSTEVNTAFKLLVDIGVAVEGMTIFRACTAKNVVDAVDALHCAVFRWGFAELTWWFERSDNIDNKQ